MWLFTSELDANWFPATSKIVVSMELGGHRIAIFVDPAVPTRWREEPYYSRIKGWAEFAASVESQVIINIGKRAIAVLPNKEVDLGVVEAEDHIMVGPLNVAAGHLPDWGAYVVKAADVPEDQRDKWVVKGAH